MKHTWRSMLMIAAVVLIASIALAACTSQAVAEPSEELAANPGTVDLAWYSLDENGVANVALHFFWSESCPHCREAHPYIMALPEELPWLQLYDYELGPIPENADRYTELAEAVGSQAIYVPAFIYCGTMQSGYSTHETTGVALKQALIECQEVAQKQLAGEEAVVVQTEDVVSLPLVGELSANALSLPALTLLIAGVDSINPCAIFVLMFLLSLMVHAKSRWRMLLIGVVFVFFSGLVYFIIMAAWLNLFDRFGQLQIITAIAGIVAIAIALINIKDFFWYKKGVSLSIPDSAKPGLYARSRRLVQADSLWAVLIGTILLAITANAYEALCTAGFPMVYTRILTMSELATSTYYAYLVAYNIIYVIPLLTIVILFAIFLGSRKLGEEEGRALKLISGMMMLMLGIVLVFAPDRMSDIQVSISLVLGALVFAGIVIIVDRRRRK